MGEHFSKQERKFGKGVTVKSFADIDKLGLGKTATYESSQTNGEPKEKNNSEKIVENIEKTEKEKIINSIPENITKDDLLCIDKLEDGKYVEGGLLGLLRNSPIEVGKNIETARGYSTKVAEIKQIGELYFIKTISGSEYRFDPKKSIKNPENGEKNIEKEITEKASNPEEFENSEKLPEPLTEQFEKIRKTDAVKQAIAEFLGKNKALKNVDLEEFADGVVNRFLRYYKDVDKDGRPVKKGEVGIPIKDIIEKPEHATMLAKLIKGAAKTESEYILGNSASSLENQKKSELEIEKAESPVEISAEINNDEKEPPIPEFATKVAKKSLHVEDEPVNDQLITPGSLEAQRQEFVEKEMEASKDFILMQMKTFSSKKERLKFLKGLKLAAEERFNSQQEQVTEERFQKQIEKIKSELELAIRDYAEIKYKKRKSWENMVGFLGKKDVQEKFDNDSEVLSMKKAYLEKMAEYKKALILNAEKGDFITKEEADYKVMDIMLDEMDKLFEANMEVRKENNEKEFADKSQETFAKYNKILPPTKENDVHDLDGKDKAEDNLTKKEANGSESEEPNGKEITGNNTAPENAPVNEGPKKHIRSEWEEIIKIMDIKGSSDTRKATINIKSSIFGKSNKHFFDVIDKNLAEIMNSQTAKEAFLEKIPKKGKTFFNKLIKQVPPEPGDTIKKWIVRVVFEAKKQT